MFEGILIEKDDAGYRATLQEIDESVLPEGALSLADSHHSRSRAWPRID